VSLKADKTGVLYRKANIAKFISEVVQGGDDSLDALSTYEKFIVDCASGEHPMPSSYGKMHPRLSRQEKIAVNR
jgi:hypothetical protein